MTGPRTRSAAPPAEPGSPAERSITTDRRWPVSKAGLARIAQLSREAGIPLLVAKNDYFDHTFVAELKALGIETTLLEAAWDRVPPDQRHVSRLDPHPSAQVHERFAEHLVDELDRRGWLKR
jgi:hypothetical protein